MAKQKRRRCDNSKCGRQYRFEQSSSLTCSAKCRTAVYRQRKADNEAEAEALALASAEAARQEYHRKATAILEQQRAKRRAAVAEEERERYQQAVKEDAEAARRRQRHAPTVDNSKVTINGDTGRYAGLMTPIPESQKPFYH